jgi:hypothetical protein
MRRREWDWFRPRGPREQAPVWCFYASFPVQLLPDSHSLHAIISIAGRWRAARRQVVRKQARPDTYSFRLFLGVLVPTSGWPPATRDAQVRGNETPPGTHNATKPERHGVLVQESALLQIPRRSTIEAPCKACAISDFKGLHFGARSCSGRCAGIADSAACRSITRPFAGGSRSRRQRSRRDCAGTGVGRAQ